MKKIKPRKLSLTTITIRALKPQELPAVAGGTTGTQACHYKISVGLCD